MKDISLHLMDIIQNSISASCTKITVSVNADVEKDILEIEVTDNGIGMEKELLEKVTNPFATTRTTRRVGLGLPLLADSARMAGGTLIIDSQKNIGTLVKADFKISHIDRIPIGELEETVTTVIISKPDMEFELFLTNNKDCFHFNSCDIRSRLGEVPITSFEVIEWIREYIQEGVKLIFGGVLNEIIS